MEKLVLVLYRYGLMVVGSEKNYCSGLFDFWRGL